MSDMSPIFSAATSQSPSNDNVPNNPCIVGVAWSAIGIGLVALPLSGETGTVLRAYNNLALGPIEDDWARIAYSIQLLPGLFEGTSPFVFLGGRIDGTQDLHPVAEEFCDAFPRRVHHFPRSRVDEWAALAMPDITAPLIPVEDAWCRQPIHAAAETALLARATIHHRRHMALAREANHGSR